MPFNISAPLRSLLIACLVGGCSDDPEPSAAPSRTNAPSAESTAAVPEPAVPEAAEVVEVPEVVVAMVPGTLRLIVLVPNALLGSEARWVTSLVAELDASELQVIRDEPSPAERSSLVTFFGGGEWTRPSEWAPHDVVLALEFVEPFMFGEPEEQPYTRGLRRVALWTAGDEEPAFSHENRLVHRDHHDGHDTPYGVSELLVQLALDARSQS